MRKVLIYIVDILLFLLAILLLLVLTPINYFYVRTKYRYSRSIAYQLDVWGNIHFAPMFNKLLIIDSGYKFGNREESISEVLGRNIIRGTLTKLGSNIVKILSPSHCLNAIQPKVSYVPIEIVDFNYMVHFINLERVKHELKPLIQEKKLTELARIKAEEMNYFNKVNHDGFEKRASISESAMMVENVCGGYSTENAMLHAYLKSEGHRMNILNKYVTHIGSGTINGYNCCLFANY